jgi:hypothetical protein
MSNDGLHKLIVSTVCAELDASYASDVQKLVAIQMAMTEYHSYGGSLIICYKCMVPYRVPHRPYIPKPCGREFCK